MPQGIIREAFTYRANPNPKKLAVARVEAK